MASVGVIYATRRLTSAGALKFYLLALSGVGLAVFTSVPHVVDNFLSATGSGIGNAGVFMLSAVLHTSLLVQGVLMLGLLGLGMLLVDLFRVSLGRRFLA